MSLILICKEAVSLCCTSISICLPSLPLRASADLVKIAREGKIKKASGRQVGLYNAIMELGLKIDVIIQSWPVKDYGLKTVIPFSDLEKSMNIE